MFHHIEYDNATLSGILRVIRPLDRKGIPECVPGCFKPDCMVLPVLGGLRVIPLEVACRV